MIYISNTEILQIFESNIYEYRSHAGINPINGHAHQERFLRSLAPKPDRISSAWPSSVYGEDLHFFVV